MKRPTNLEDANKIIKKLLYNKAQMEISIAYDQGTRGCPYAILGNPMKIEVAEECENCRQCKEEFWEAYEKMIYDKYKLEDE